MFEIWASSVDREYFAFMSLLPKQPTNQHSQRCLIILARKPTVCIWRMDDAWRIGSARVNKNLWRQKDRAWAPCSWGTPTPRGSSLTGGREPWHRGLHGCQPDAPLPLSPPAASLTSARKSVFTGLNSIHQCDVLLQLLWAFILWVGFFFFPIS